MYSLLVCSLAVQSTYWGSVQPVSLPNHTLTWIGLVLKAVNQYFKMHILLPETDKCPWISRRELPQAIFQDQSSNNSRSIFIKASWKHAYMILTPLNSFYVVKRVYRGIHYPYIIFLISAQKHRLWVLLRTASSRLFKRYPQSVFRTEIWKISEFFIWKFSFFFFFFVVKFSVYLNRHVFVMGSWILRVSKLATYYHQSNTYLSDRGRH